MIYLLEDDESIRKLVIYALETQGFKATGFGSAETFWPAMKEKRPLLVILDIMLPGEDGISVLKKIRKNDDQLPVIMLTAKTTEYDRVEGLNAGADDYISKPFGIMELIARVKALLRRTECPSGGDISVRELVLSPSRREVLVSGERINLTFKEFELLVMLLEHQEKVLTREILLEKIWGIDDGPENRTLDVHIRTLRSKLGSAGEYVQTVRGVGYKFSVKEHG